HGMVEPRLGVPTDRVAETLQVRFQRNAPSSLVLCPCSAGESALTSEVLRSSVLAHYLDYGLTANGGADSEKDIWVRELVAITNERVDRWAQNNLGVHQLLRLFGNGDFVIAPRGRETPAKKAVPDLIVGYPAALQRAWEKRDQAIRRGATRLAGRQLVRLEA